MGVKMGKKMIFSRCERLRVERRSLGRTEFCEVFNAARLRYGAGKHSVRISG